MNRRQFTKSVLSTAAAAGIALHAGSKPSRAAASEASKSNRRIRLGGKVFIKTEDPEKLALEHVRLGYRAAYCPAVGINDTARIAAIRAAFEKHGVVIAEVGRWCNMMDADPAKRKQNIDNVTEGLALADAVGARCCVDIAGSFSTEQWFGPHPKNLSREFFDAAVENARKIIDAVKPKTAKFAYEMMGWALPDSPDSYLEMIKAVDRPAFGVHFDPCNLVNSPSRFYRNADLFNECFDKLGKHIVSCHAKDLAWDVEMNVHFREVPPGAGKMDYPTLLKGLAALNHDAPFMMEHCASEAEYTQGREFIQKLAPTLGLQI